MPRHELKLPDLGLADQPITLSLWLVRRNSPVTQGQAVAEILCGAALIDLPSPVDGRLIKKLVDTDATIAPGQILAIIETEDP